MKLFQFQSGENTRFVYQNKPEKQDHSEILAAAQECRDEIVAELGALNQEVFAEPEKRFNEQLLSGEKIELSTGWTVRLGGTFPDDAYRTETFQPDGSIYMKRTIEEPGEPRVRQSLTKRSSGKLIMREKEDGKKWQVVKTFRNPANLKVVRNEEIKIRARNDEENTIKKVVERVPGRNNVVVFNPDETVKRTRGEVVDEAIVPKIQNLQEDVVEDIQEIREDAPEMLTEEAQEELQQIDDQIEVLLTNYTIKPGDTISDIVSFCRDANGNAPNWKDVYEVNKNNLRSGNPDLIFPEEKLKLPDGYKLNTVALDAKQLKNLNDWYGEKEALEGQAQETNTNQENVATSTETEENTAAQTSGETETSSDLNDLLLSDIESNEEIEQITPDDIANAFTEANKEDASEEAINKATDYFFNEDRKKDWKPEDYDKAGESLGLDPKVFDSITDMGGISGDKTLEELSQRKEKLNALSQEISDWKERYPNLMEKSDRLKESLKKFDESLLEKFKEIDEAIKNLRTPEDIERLNKLPIPLGKLKIKFNTPEEEVQMAKVIQQLIDKNWVSGPDDGFPFFIQKGSGGKFELRFMKYDPAVKEAAPTIALEEQWMTSQVSSVLGEENNLREMARFLNEDIPTVKGHSWKHVE
jgi:hypothetical protein